MAAFAAMPPSSSALSSRRAPPYSAIGVRLPETMTMSFMSLLSAAGAGFRSCERITGKLIPLLVKEGWPRHQKMVPFRKGADGVVARESRFATRFDTFARERPPRLRRFGGFATFY